MQYSCHSFASPAPPLSLHHQEWWGKAVPDLVPLRQVTEAAGGLRPKCGSLSFRHHSNSLLQAPALGGGANDFLMRLSKKKSRSGLILIPNKNKTTCTMVDGCTGVGVLVERVSDRQTMISGTSVNVNYAFSGD